MKMNINLKWFDLLWPRPFDEDTARDLLTGIATTSHRGHIVFEAHAAFGKIRYAVGIPEYELPELREVFRAALPNAQLREGIERSVQMTTVKSIKLMKPVLSLSTSGTEAVIRALLAALAQTKRSGDETVVQIILGRARPPSLLPDKLQDPTASWLDILRGSVGRATSETRRLMREKAECYGFSCAVRIGAKSSDTLNEHRRINVVYSALKTLETAGARLSLVPVSSDSLNDASRPWHFPLHLSVRELPAFLGWPLGETEFAGVEGLHPRIMMVPRGYIGNARQFGESTFGDTPLGISAQDSLYHTVLLAPTGGGKSTAMLNLILSDIAAGRSVCVIDPKADLVNDILARVPKSRENDVVVLDPSDACPVGINPLDGGQNPALTADTILSIMQDLFADSWGIRTQDIMSAALLTLTRIKGATLIWLPALLTDDRFRGNILKNISDPVGLDAFWAGFDAMSIPERNQVIAPVLNKLRQFLLRPELRAVLGQAEPKFNMRDIFHKRRIVLVPLNKGLMGNESAKLIGSLIIGQLWMLALGRAAITPERRHVVGVYIDEVQNYLRLPGDLADALSQARGLGIALTIAHQYRNQLPTNLRAAIDANVHNKIIFGLNASDARDMASMSTELDSSDFMLLPRYGIYVNLQYRGRSTGWVSGRTLPPPPAIQPAFDLKVKSMATYGMDANEVEKAYLSAIGYTDNKDIDASDVPVGRRKRGET